LFPWLRVCSAAFLAVVVAGCKSSAVGGNTPLPPTGRPEVTLDDRTTVNQVQAIAQDFFRERNYVESESKHRYEFVFDKPTKGGRGGRALRVRLRLNNRSDGSWQLTGTPLGVEGWRSDLESEVVLPQGSSQIQGFLVEIKSRVESAR
jgi:hypothetical protein